MTRQLTPHSGHEHDGIPRPRTESLWTESHGVTEGHGVTKGHRAPAANLGSDLGMRPGESDPGRMLAGVLVLVIATIILALAWWLA
jgi:hypothetical protein